MRFPCEYIASDFLPGLRIRVAYHLREAGLSQNEIADHLSVKQPVIVSYLKSYQERILQDGEDNIHLDTLADEITKLILENHALPLIMRTVCTRCKSLRTNSYICTKHKEIIPEISYIKNCDICSGFTDQVPKITERAKIIQTLQTNFSKIRAIDSLIEWIPEIGSQLAYSSEDASHPDDIASFPGRIIKVKDDILTVREPEFGTSKTMSQMLLWIRKYQPTIRWIVSIKNRKNLKTILQRNDIKFVETKNLDLQWKETLKQTSKTAKISEIEVLVDSGSKGYEAIAYIFAPNSEKLVTIIQQICQS